MLRNANSVNPKYANTFVHDSLHSWRNYAGETIEEGITNENTVASSTLFRSSMCAISKHKYLDQSDDVSATEINLNNNTDSDGTFQCLRDICNFLKISNKHVS